MRKQEAWRHESLLSLGLSLVVCLATSSSAWAEEGHRPLELGSWRLALEAPQPIDDSEQVGLALEQREAWQELALAQAQREGAAPDELGVLLDRLADTYFSLGKHDEARAALDCALTLKIEALGPDDPSIADTLARASNIASSDGCPDKAVDLIERGLELRMKAFGPEHPAVAASLRHLAAFHMTQGRAAKAETFIRRALVIQEKALGGNHTMVAGLLLQLGDALEAQGRKEEASLVSERGLDILEAHNWKEDPLPPGIPSW